MNDVIKKAFESSDAASEKSRQTARERLRQPKALGEATACDDVPTHGLTLTIPTKMSGAHLFYMVPGPTKKAVVRETLYEPISTAYPSTILWKQPDCTLLVYSESTVCWRRRLIGNHGLWR